MAWMLALHRQGCHSVADCLVSHPVWLLAALFSMAILKSAASHQTGFDARRDN